MDRDCTHFDGSLPPSVPTLDCATKAGISVSNELIQRAHVYNLFDCYHWTQIMPKPILLSVDDDSDVLRAIERDLRSQYGAEYRVIGSDSPDGALDLLKQLKVRNDSVALLLADQRMHCTCFFIRPPEIEFCWWI